MRVNARSVARALRFSFRSDKLSNMSMSHWCNHNDTMRIGQVIEDTTAMECVRKDGGCGVTQKDLGTALVAQGSWTSKFKQIKRRQHG